VKRINRPAGKRHTILFAKKENRVAFSVVLKPGAADGIETAYNWYEDQKGGVGEVFLTNRLNFTESWKVTRWLLTK
jgi:hypothetical protein